MEKLVYRSKASIAYSILKEKISSGHYQYGQILSANALSEELGMSRTPILEAFKMLETEEVVNVIPQVGVIVKPMNPDSVLGRFTLQAILEGYLAGEAAKRVNLSFKNELIEFIMRMDECVLELDSRRYSELNLKFHFLIMDTAGYPYLKDTVLQIYDQNRYENLRPILFGVSMNKSLDEHKHIVEAISNQDEMKVRALMEQHIIERRREYIEKLSKKRGG